MEFEDGIDSKYTLKNVIFVIYQYTGFVQY